MIALLQRVSHASVVVDGETTGAITAGLMVLVCAERGDSETEADALLNKLLTYRVFSDDAGKMNLSITDTQGGLLLVPQFTLAANTNAGTRPRSHQPHHLMSRANCSTILSGKQKQTQHSRDWPFWCRHESVADQRRP
jgi:D-tyrosyl-tRNA(Tyr) deacylase